MQRRRWLKALLAGLAPARLRASTSAGEALVFEDLKFHGDGKFVRQARLLVDPHIPPERLLILLHGRGEADSVVLALKAWSHLYGLIEAYARLQHPPIDSVVKEPRWENERAAQINSSLVTRPFRGLALVCPVTPNAAAFGNRNALYDSYTQWLTSELVPEVRARLPSLGERVGVDGCSMGGALAFEVFLKRPDFFGSFGAVQAAIGVDRAAALTERFKVLKPTQKLPRLHLLTSSSDPYRQANEQLSQQLHAKLIANTLDVIHGPHNQAWLRQMGTLAMLLWHDREL